MFIVGNEMSSRPTLDGTRDVKRAEEKKKKKKRKKFGNLMVTHFKWS